MDFHFVKPTLEVDSETTGSDLRQFSRIIKRFLPVFVLAAFLPFLIGFVVSPPDIGFFTQADTEPELRIWFDPASVITNVGRRAKLDVYAQFDADNKLIPEVSFEFMATGSADLSDNTMTYSTPFRGKVFLGSVYVTPRESGEVIVEIPEETARVVAFDGSYEVNTGRATITVR